MATDVYYNGIQLHNVTTRNWEQEVIYDQTNTDVIFNRFTLTFEGILHVQAGGVLSDAPAWIAGAGAAGPAAQSLMYEYVRERLGQNRGELLVTWNDEVALRCVECTRIDDPDRDVENGPQPQNVSIIHVVSNQLIKVRFTIKCAKVECPDGTPVPIVINNRWSIAEDMDENFYVTRRIRGRIRLSDSVRNVQAWKPIVVPGLEAGFRRQSVEFATSADGLTADYHVIDRQVHTSAPWPATRISGNHTESTADGVHFFAEASIRLEGPVHADKRKMMERAVQAVQQRLRLDDPARRLNVDYRIEQGAIVDHIGQTVNAVEARLRIRHYPKDPGEFLANLRKTILGKPLSLPATAGEPFLYDPRVSLTPHMYGYNSHGDVRIPDAALFIMQVFLQNPCVDDHAIRSPYPLVPQEEDNPFGGTEVEGGVSEGDLPDYDGDNQIDGDIQELGMYDYARHESRYTFAPIRVQMPIASVPGGGGIDPTDDTCVVLSLAEKQAQREIRYEAERVGGWPHIPEPADTYTDGSLSGTLLKYWDREQAPVLTPDGGQKIFKIEAYYLYALNRAPTNSESTRVGVLPFTTHEQSDAALIRGDIHDTKLQV